MTDSTRVDRNGQYAMMALGVLLPLVLLARVALIPAMSPPATIALIWTLTVPISYLALGGETPSAGTAPQLPGVPMGLRWQTPSRRRQKAVRKGAKKGCEKELRRVLSMLGYTHAAANDPGADLVARSADGKKVVVKICEGRAGVLACQDAMRAMLDTGASEAIVVASKGSSPAANRFVRDLRSRKGVWIRIWSQPNFARPRTSGHGRYSTLERKNKYVGRAEAA